MTTFSVPNVFIPSTVMSSSQMNANFTAVDNAFALSLGLDGADVMTGQFKAANGNAAAPSMTFGSDLNTGFFRKGSDDIGFAVNGVEIGDWTATALTLLGQLNLGNASDTTFARVSAGVASIEGSNILLASGVGSIVQPFDADLSAIAALAVTANNFIMANGAAWTAVNGAAARTGLGAIGGAPSVQRFLAGAANYTPTAGTKFIRVRMVGGGGGGGGQSANNGGTGGTTSFGVWTAIGGTGGIGGEDGITNGNQGGNGGTGGANGTGTLITRFDGQPGSKGGATNAARANSGGTGGNSVFGGGGQPGHNTNAGGAARANTGSGGGGASLSAGANDGTGGGAGEYVEFFVSAPGVIAYSVGALGAGGAAGGSAGGDGAAGIIIIEEYI